MEERKGRKEEVMKKSREKGIREGIGEMREGKFHHSYHLTAEYIWKLEMGMVLKRWERGKRRKGEVRPCLINSTFKVQG